jgi:hypothetical protein
VIQNYTAPGDSNLFALNLDPDGTSFWTGDLGNGDIAHFDIASGTELGHFNGLAAGGGSSVAGLSVAGEVTRAHFAITLTPPTGSDAVGGSHTVTATTTNGGAPLAGQTVSFSITSGPNAGKSGSGVTNVAGQTTFTYTDTGGAGTDTIAAQFTTSSGSIVKAKPVTETWTAATDRTPPACALTSVVAGPPKQLKITVGDTGSGLKSVVVTTATNASVQVPTFTVGTTSSIVVTATKTNQAIAAGVALKVTDVAGNVTNCDPIITTIARGDDSAQTYRGVAQAESLILISNGSPGLRNLAVIVNGQRFVVSLKPGESRTLNVSWAMHAGANNWIRLRGHGPKGSSADVVIHD